MTAALNQLLCPKCGGPLEDQRPKAKPTQPDFKCANPGCVNEKGYRTGVWLDKLPRRAPAQTGYAREQAPRQPLTERPAALAKPEQILPWETSPKDEQLVTLYWTCFDEVLAGLKSRALKDGFHDEQVAAMTATLYIARSKLL